MRATARVRPCSPPGWPGWCWGSSAGCRTPRTAAGAHPAPQLTERETEILRLVATGMGYKEIASELFLSHRTVQNHVQNTLGKLHLHNRVELARFAMDHGLDGPADPRVPASHPSAADRGV